MGALDVDLTPAGAQQISAESGALRVHGERMDSGNMALVESTESAPHLPEVGLPCQWPPPR